MSFSGSKKPKTKRCKTLIFMSVPTFTAPIGSMYGADLGAKVRINLEMSELFCDFFLWNLFFWSSSGVPAKVTSYNPQLRKYSWNSRTVLSLLWHSSPAVTGKFCHCGGRTVLLRWHCIATAANELCHGSDNAVPSESWPFLFHKKFTRKNL